MICKHRFCIYEVHTKSLGGEKSPLPLMFQTATSQSLPLTIYYISSFSFGYKGRSRGESPCSILFLIQSVKSSIKLRSLTRCVRWCMIISSTCCRNTTPTNRSEVNERNDQHAQRLGCCKGA